MSSYNIILASNSPRRKELLSRFISRFEIKPADIDETINIDLPIKEAVLDIAKRKGLTILKKAQYNDFIISADTVVVLDNIIYGKPKDTEEAFLMLKSLQGKKHQVITGVYCISGCQTVEISFAEVTEVEFIKLDDKAIWKYIDTNEPMDKAGAYAIQGIGSILVKKIIGDYDNVVGLPIGKLIRKLIKNNIITI